MSQNKCKGTVDYTFPHAEKAGDRLLELDREYESLTGAVGLAYISRPGDGSSRYVFGTGEVRLSRKSAIRYFEELLGAE